MQFVGNGTDGTGNCTRILSEADDICNYKTEPLLNKFKFTEFAELTKSTTVNDRWYN